VAKILKGYHSREGKRNHIVRTSSANEGKDSRGDPWREGVDALPRSKVQKSNGRSSNKRGKRQTKGVFFSYKKKSIQNLIGVHISGKKNQSEKKGYERDYTVEKKSWGRGGRGGKESRTDWRTGLLRVGNTGGYQLSVGSHWT